MKTTNKHKRQVTCYWLTEKNEVVPVEQSLFGCITQKMVEALRWQSRNPDVLNYDLHYSFQKAMEEEMRKLRW